MCVCVSHSRDFQFKNIQQIIRFGDIPLNGKSIVAWLNEQDLIFPFASSRFCLFSNLIAISLSLSMSMYLCVFVMRNLSSRISAFTKFACYLCHHNFFFSFFAHNKKHFLRIEDEMRSNLIFVSLIFNSINRIYPCWYRKGFIVRLLTSAQKRHLSWNYFHLIFFFGSFHTQFYLNRLLY